MGIKIGETMNAKFVNSVRVSGIHEGVGELVVSFNNDRHHAMRIERGDSRDLFVKKLHLFAHQIQQDELLNNRKETK